MTPAARYAAAIEILDAVVDQVPAEKALTNWARKNRYAGSKDRAAVRDHVFDVLRKRRSCAAYGGGEDGRALILGLVRQSDQEEEKVFTGEGYAPSQLTDGEAGFVSPRLMEAEKHDLPDWAWALWQRALGEKASDAAMSQRERAELALRVNTRRSSIEAAIQMLSEDAINALRHPDVDSCLVVKTNPRRLAQSQAYLTGVVEVQDASSQAAVASWPLGQGLRVLDFCAGGGGKALAMAAMHSVEITAHDIDASRMKDIPVRAARAGVEIDQRTTDELAHAGPFDAVVCDAPCSGSGTWRRTPDAKWRLTEQDIAAFRRRQLDVLRHAQQFVPPRGLLIYATCSVFTAENEEVIAGFGEENPDFARIDSQLLVPTHGNDGFYYCVLKRS